MDLYLPALPSLARGLHTSATLGQWTMSACMIGLATGQLFAGPISDRIGRRRPLLIGVALYAVLSVLCAVAPNIGLLILFRLLQGMGGAAGLAISRAMVRDLYENADIARIFSLLMLVSGTAPVLAPLLGGQLIRVMNWRGLFLTLAVIGIVLAVAAALVLPETLPVEQRHGGGLRTVRSAFVEVSRDRLFAAAATVLAVGAVGLFTYISVSSFVLERGFGLSAQTFSVIFGVNSAGIVLAGLVNSRLVRRHPPQRVLIAGLTSALLAGGLALCVGVFDLPLGVLLAALFVLVAATGFLLPNASALALARHRRNAGTASAIMGAGQFLVGALIAPLASIGGATVTSMSTVIVIALAVAVTVAIIGVYPAAATSAAVEPVIEPSSQ